VGGFLADSYTSENRSPSLVPRCGLCGLYKGCYSPKMKVDGKGRRGILIVGEAPGREEDEKGIPFIGKAGRKLQDALNSVGIDLREDCWITNALICRPPNNKIPKEKMVEWCRPNVTQAIRDLKPSVILLLGGQAVKSVIGEYWTDDIGAVGRWVGWKIPSQALNSWICPTWHPSYLERLSSALDDMTEKFWLRHLRAVTELDHRPWDRVPDYRKQIRCCFDHKNAATGIKEMAQSGKPVAFDYETDRLKPDHEDARIVCAAVSDGERSIAYPWDGDAVQATLDLLESKIPKWGWNAKFEDRWTRRYGRCVRNWRWDGMLASHVLDNRGGITGLKFQAFVRLGIGTYDDTVKPFFQARGGNDQNQIRRISVEDLLRYCGMDALLEWKVSQLQQEEFGP